MKRLSLLLFLLGGCSMFSATDGEVKFKNPLFYKTMDPVSRIVWKTTLTPTQKAVDNGYGYIETNECDLVENEQTYVGLMCNRYRNCEENGQYKDCKVEQKDHLYRYTIRPIKPETESYLQARWIVEEKIFDEKGKRVSTATLMIK